MPFIGEVNARVKQNIKSLPDPDGVGVIGEMPMYQGEILTFEERKTSDGTIYYRAKGYAWHGGWLEFLNDKLLEGVEEL